MSLLSWVALSRFPNGESIFLDWQSEAKCHGGQCAIELNKEWGH